MSCSQISGCFVTPLGSYSRYVVLRECLRRKLVKSIFMVSCLCLAVASLLFSPSSASALSFSGQNLIPILAGSSFVYAADGSRLTLVSNSGTPSGATGTFTGAMLNKWATRISLKFNGKRTTAHSLVSVSGRFCGGVNADAFVSLEPDQYYSIVWSTISSGTDKCTNFNYVFYTDGSHDNINLQGRLFWVNTDSTVDFNPISMTTLDREPTRDQLVEIHNRLNIVNGNLDSIEGKLDTTNSTLNSIKNSLAGLNLQGVVDSQNKTTAAVNDLKTATNNAANQAHKDSQAQIDATNKQTEQQKEQYDKDKQEEQDRENQGSEDANKAAGIFDFNLLNPFGALFEFFIGSQNCASIPTLARWVHSDTSTVCSWWSSDVISVLTPVFGISSIILLFGFFIKWLRGSDFIDVELLK